MNVTTHSKNEANPTAQLQILNPPPQSPRGSACRGSRDSGQKSSDPTARRTHLPQQEAVIATAGTGHERSTSADANPETSQPGAILVVEDDISMSQLLSVYLQHEGFRTLEATDGTGALKLARDADVALVILDLNLPGLDGNDVCTQLRSFSDVPIIMVTARVDEEDRLKGLNLGADDYVTKPFSPRELMARIQAVLRRTNRDLSPSKRSLKRLIAGPYQIDLETRTAMLGDVDLTLSPTEYQLLIYFVRSNRKTVNRDQIIQNALGPDFAGFHRTVDTHISNLRRKLEQASGGVRHLRTVYGVGYRFDAS